MRMPSGVKKKEGKGEKKKGFLPGGGKRNAATLFDTRTKAKGDLEVPVSAQGGKGGRGGKGERPR